MDVTDDPQQNFMARIPHGTSNETMEVIMRLKDYSTMQAVEVVWHGSCPTQDFRRDHWGNHVPEGLLNHVDNGSGMTLAMFYFMLLVRPFISHYLSLLIFFLVLCDKSLLGSTIWWGSAPTFFSDYRRLKRSRPTRSRMWTTSRS